MNWVCSTGLFQLALVWFRLGELERGNKAFSHACKLQNASGGGLEAAYQMKSQMRSIRIFPIARLAGQ